MPPQAKTIKLFKVRAQFKGKSSKKMITLSWEKVKATSVSEAKGIYMKGTHFINSQIQVRRVRTKTK